MDDMKSESNTGIRYKKELKLERPKDGRKIEQPGGINIVRWLKPLNQIEEKGNTKHGSFKIERFPKQY